MESSCLICAKSEGPVTYSSSNNTLPPELIEERNRKKGISALAKLLYLPDSLIGQLDQLSYCYTCITKLGQLESIFSQLEYFQGKVVQNRREIELELIAAVYRDDQQGNNSSATTKSTRKIICDLIQGKHDVILTKSNGSNIEDDSTKKSQQEEQVQEEENEMPPRKISSDESTGTGGSEITLDYISNCSSKSKVDDNSITIQEPSTDSSSNNPLVVESIQNGSNNDCSFDDFDDDDDGAKEKKRKLIDSYNKTISKVIKDSLKSKNDQNDKEDKDRINENHNDSMMSKNADKTDQNKRSKRNKVKVIEVGSSDNINLNVNNISKNETSTQFDNTIKVNGNENKNQEISSSVENAENDEIMPVLDSFMNNPSDEVINDNALVNQIQGPPQLDSIYLKVAVEAASKKKLKKYKGNNSAIDMDLSNNSKVEDPVSLEDICRTKQPIVLLNRLGPFSPVDPVVSLQEDKNISTTTTTTTTTKSTEIETSQSQNTPTGLSGKIKRGRGRPRKCPVEVIIQTKTSTPTDNQSTSSKSESQSQQSISKRKMSQREINIRKLSKARTLNIRRANTNRKNEMEDEDYNPPDKVPKVESNFRTRLLKKQSSKTSVLSSQNFRRKREALALTRNKRGRKRKTSGTKKSDIFVRKSERIFLKTEIISPSKSKEGNNLENSQSTSNLENGVSEQTCQEIEAVPTRTYSRKSQRLFHQNQKQESTPIPIVPLPSKPSITKDRGQISPDIISSNLTLPSTNTSIEIPKNKVKKTNKSLKLKPGKNISKSSKEIVQEQEQVPKKVDKNKICNNCSKSISSKHYQRHLRRCLAKNLTNITQKADDKESLKKGNEEIVKSPVEVLKRPTSLSINYGSNELDIVISSNNETVDNNESAIVGGIEEATTSKTSKQISVENTQAKKRARLTLPISSNSNNINADVSNKMLVTKTKAQLKEFSNHVNDTPIQNIPSVDFSTTSLSNLQKVINQISKNVENQNQNDNGNNTEMNNHMEIQDILRTGIDNDIVMSISDENENEPSSNKSTDNLMQMNDIEFSIIEETSLVQKINLPNNTAEVKSKDFEASNVADETVTETEDENSKKIENEKVNKDLESNIELIQNPTEKETHNPVVLEKDSEIRTDDKQKTEKTDNLASTSIKEQKEGCTSFRCPYTTCPILFPDKTQLIVHLKHHMEEELVKKSESAKVK